MLLHSKFPVFFWFFVQHVPLVKWVHVHLYFARHCRKFHGRIASIRSSRGTEQRKNRYLFSLYFYVVPADAQCSVNSNRFDFILLFFLSVSLFILCVRAYVWACFVVLHRICLTVVTKTTTMERQHLPATMKIYDKIHGNSFDCGMHQNGKHVQCPSNCRKWI